MAGQIFTVPVCSDHVPAASQPANFQCPAGQSAYFVSAYLSDSSTESIDTSSAATFFGFGFGIVIFFWVLGLKSSLLIKPFWR